MRLERKGEVADKEANRNQHTKNCEKALKEYEKHKEVQKGLHKRVKMLLLLLLLEL